MSRTGPIRSCVGCGGRDAQQALIRIVAGAEGLRLDPARRAPGRGGYLHRRPACWQSFVGRRGAVRSLRTTPARAERERLVTRLTAEVEVAR